MEEDIISTPDSDIYKTWGKSKYRVDIPAIGREYHDWKDNTPLDVQKIILDYMTARNMEFFFGYFKKSKDEIDDRYYPTEEADRQRKAAIEQAQTSAHDLFDFFRENHPELLTDLVAIGMDGSSLYRPRKGGDIDIWLMVKENSEQLDDAFTEFIVANKEKDRETNISPRIVLKNPDIKYLEQGQVPVLSLPHKMLLEINISEKEYVDLKRQTDEFVRDHMEMIYGISRKTATYWL